MITLYHRKGALSIPNSEAKKKWDKENTKLVVLKLHKRIDKDIFTRLEEVPNKQGYIKSLIRTDITKQKE